MNSSQTASNSKIAAPSPGLPGISYYPSVIATLLATIVLLLFMSVLVFFGIVNVLNQLGRTSSGSTEGSPLFAGMCGLVGLLGAVGVVYFVIALVRGIRDLREPLYFTRGAVPAGNSYKSKRRNNWLVVERQYAGPDLALASEVNDEQRAASTDRSQVFEPRSAGGAFANHPHQPDADIKRELASMERGGGYLKPERISSVQAASEDEAKGGRAAFRIDFASRANIGADEQVLVAHSRFMQHVFYVARLRNGEWEAVVNKALI